MVIPLSSYENLGRGTGALAGTAPAIGNEAGWFQKLHPILEALDYPRQALWNAPRSIQRALDESDASELLGAIPGAIGAAGLGLGALTGLGLPAAIGLGGLAAGIGQGIGKSTENTRFDAPTTTDLVEALGGDPEGFPGQALGFGLGILGDPLTYAGGLGGAKSGAQYGRRLENLAEVAGPKYQTTFDQLANMVRSSPRYSDNAMYAERHLGALKKNPNLETILGEIHPESELLGTGMSKFVLKSPERAAVAIDRPSEVLQSFRDTVTRGQDGDFFVNPEWTRAMLRNEPLEPMISSPFSHSTVPPTRPDVPGVLQPHRSRPIAGDMAVRVEHMPIMETPLMEAGKPGWGPWQDAYERMGEDMRRAGVQIADTHHGNIGRVGNEYRMIDPGELRLHPSAWQTEMPRAAEMMDVSVQPNAIDNLILRALGSKHAVRKELADRATRLSPYVSSGASVPMPQIVNTVPEMIIPAKRIKIRTDGPLSEELNRTGIMR